MVGAILGRFESGAALKDAAEQVRDEGYRKWDCHSPFPIHGMERAMGIRPTILPWLVFGAGLTGAAAALLLQWWTNAVDYPFVISGKPFFSVPANIPVTFEVIILFSALAAFGGALILNQLPQFRHPVFASDEFRRATSDGFFISIETGDPKFDEAKTAKFLESLGASVEVCRVPVGKAVIPQQIPLAVLFVVTLAFLPPFGVLWYRESTKREPRIHPLHDMAFQPKYKTQTANGHFADGRAMRPPIPGTIARGSLTLDTAFFEGKDAEGNYVGRIPITVTERQMLRGREEYRIYCAPCHGHTGGMPEGVGGDDVQKWDGMVSIRASERAAMGDGSWTPPRALHSDYVQDQPDGKIFETISVGVNNEGIQTMPGYAEQIPPEDRWAIVMYVRALGLSQNAPEEQVPESKRTAPPPVDEEASQEEQERENTEGPNQKQ